MQAAQAPNNPKIVSKRELPVETGLSIRHCEGLIALGLFPAPIRLSSRRIGWLADEIAAWRERKRRERDAANDDGFDSDQLRTELSAAEMKIDKLERRILKAEDDLQDRDDKIDDLETALEAAPSELELEHLAKAVRARDWEGVELWLHRIGARGF